MEIEELYHCIDRYLTGDATQSEVELVDTWYDSFDKLPGFDLKEKDEIKKSGKQNFLLLKNLINTDELLNVTRLN